MDKRLSEICAVAEIIFTEFESVPRLQAQKKLFENFTDAQREVSILTDAETLSYSFKVGAQIMLDALTDSPMKEI